MDRVRAAIRVRHYSRRTEDAYSHWIRRFVVFNGKRHPDELGNREISLFLASLATDGQVAASTQNQALSALLFLYTKVLQRDVGAVDRPVAKVPVRVPVVLTVNEVRLVLRQLSGVPWLVAALLYGAGVRLQECLELRIKDVDFERRELTIRRGKGQKDRRVMLPAALSVPLGHHLEGVRAQHQRDLAAGFGRVALPEALDRKYLNAATSGCGSSCFPLGGFARIRSTVRRPASTCTRARYNGPLRWRRGRQASPSA